MKKLLFFWMGAMLVSTKMFALLTTPSMALPTHGATNQTVNVMLDWGTSTGATYYEYKLSTSPTLAGATATSTGASTYYYTSNLLFNTTYYWSARARSATDSSNWTTIYMFTTHDNVFPTSPTNGAIGQDVNPYINWTDVSGITYYDFEMDTTASFNSSLHVLVPISGVTTSYYYPTNLLFGQKYYWRVRARHALDTTSWSTTWNFTTHNNIYQTSPTNGATGQDVDPYVNWTDVSGISHYDFEMDTTASFNSSLHVLAPISGETTSYYYPTNLLFGQKYYWRVRARHALDTTSWSTTWNFTTHNNIYQTSPTNGATGQDVDPYVNWTDVSGISHYDFEMDTTASFNSSLHVLAPISGETTSYYYPTNLLFGQKYYWRVRARHALDTTSWSTTWNFTTHNNVYQTSPTNGATGQDVDPYVNWTDVSGVSHYDFEMDTTASFNSSLHILAPISGETTSYYYPTNLLFGQKYYWRVRARHALDTTSWSTIWNFTTHNNVYQTSPANGATGQDVDPYVNWTDVSGVSHYDFEMDTTASFNSSLHVMAPISGETTSYYYPSNLLFGQKYYWRVRARHASDTTSWSTTWNFTTHNNVYQTSPTNGATGQLVDPYINWTDVSGISYYDFEMDTTASFNSSLHVLAPISGETTSYYYPSDLLFNQKYYWRVRARHSADTTTWSTVWDFTTTDGKPAHVSPANAATSVSLNPTIDWGTVSGITAYQYEYSVDPIFTSATPVGTGTTSQAGLVSLSYGQTYYWRVRSCHTNDTSDWSTPWSFTTLYQLTSPVVLSSPANGTTGLAATTTTLQWQSYATAVFYEYMYANNSGFTGAVSGTAVSTSQVTSSLAPGTTYYWKVRANNGSGYSPWSTTWTFATSGLGVPILISPANGASSQPLSITFDWADAASATFYEYEVDDDIMFGSPFANGSVTSSTTSISSLAFNTTYYWRVRSSDGSNYSAWSSTWSFTTATLSAPVLVSPSNGASNQPLALTLNWDDVAAANSYEYYYDTDIAFSNPVHAIVTVSEVAISGLSNNVTYYWKVRSSDGVQYSAFTSPWSFTTTTGVGMDESAEFISMYPNPAIEFAYLKFDNSKERTISIFDLSGKLMMSTQSNDIQIRLELGSLPAGIYQILVTNAEATHTLRLIKQ